MKIKIGHDYIFTKSGNIVTVKEKRTVVFSGLKIKGYSVVTKSGKGMFCPAKSLIQLTPTEE